VQLRPQHRSRHRLLRPASVNSSVPPSARPGNGAGAGSGAFAALVQPVSLKSGLSAVVNITIQEKNGILLVPNRAISRQGRNTVVQIVTGTTTEARTVQTGISDATNTEIVSGLNEGDQISLSTGTPSATPSNTNRPGGIPGIGGGIRIGG
jgi:macrolide-specific efflux system membrane fusion protein